MKQNSEWTTSRLSPFERAYLECCENGKDNNEIKKCLDKKLNEFSSKKINYLLELDLCFMDKNEKVVCYILKI